jgi:hypothetical protein
MREAPEVAAALDSENEMQPQGAAQALLLGRRTTRRDGPRRGVIVTLGCLAALLALLVVASGHWGESRRSGMVGAAASRVGTLGRLRSLPLQAQSAISTAVSSGQAAFAAKRTERGYGLAGGGVSADLDGRGALVRGAGGSLAMLKGAKTGFHPGDRGFGTLHAAAPAGSRGASAPSVQTLPKPAARAC